MTNKASGRSAAFLAIVLLLGFASASHAATGTGGIWSPQAASTEAQAPGGMQLAASDQLNDADRAVTEPAQAAPSAAAPVSQPETQGQSVAPVVAASDQGSDTSTLIGKIFIGFGTLLTLGSAATKMLLT